MNYSLLAQSSESGGTVRAFFFIALAIVLFILYRKFFKIPAFGAVTMITGGVKCGKSALTVYFAVREYKRAVFRWKMSCALAKLFRRIPPEKPMLYSNIPLRKVDYVPLTVKHLLREERLASRSVVIMDEASLVADSMLIKDKNINTQLLLFFKLFGHETHGGKIFINSHCISDLHYSMKRCTSSYYYVNSLSKLPFISIFHAREERFSDDGSVVNTYTEDVSKSLLRLLMFNSTFKKYDAYCYSVLTDDLPCNVKPKYLKEWNELKTRQITSFRTEFQKIGVIENDK